MSRTGIRRKPKRHQSNTPTLEINRNYSVPDGARAVGVAPITFWRAIYAGHLQTYRIGRRRVVSGAQIQQWMDAGGKTGFHRAPTAGEMGLAAG